MSDARPELRVLRFVQRIEAYHLPLITRAVSKDWGQPSLESIVAERDNGALALWEFEDHSALVITEINNQPAGSELFLVGAAGSGMIAAAEDMIADLKTIAGVYGCRWIGGLGIPEGWEKPALAHGFRRAATYYLMELEDGQG